MDEKYAQAKAVMEDILLKDNFSVHLGIEVLDVSEDRITARIPFKKELTNNYGSLHGGVVFSFADILAGTLACMGGKFASTAEGNMNYLRPAMAREYVYGEAVTLREGKHLVVVETRLTNEDGLLLDVGTFTFFKSEVDVVKGE